MSRLSRSSESLPVGTGKRPRSRPFRLALAQINSTVGDLEANTEKIIYYIKKARKLGADLVAFPELAITGYPPEDLLLKPQFIKDNQNLINRIAPYSKQIAVITGFASGGETSCLPLQNAAAIMAGGRLVDVYHKIHLPNYGVFDEVRYFQPGQRCPVYEQRGVVFGVTICEDIWFSEGPASTQAEAGAVLIININASPYNIGKISQRKKHITGLARSNTACIAYVNIVGGQDELVFDGGSMVISHTGKTCLMAPQFEEDLYIVDLDIDAVRQARSKKTPWNQAEDWLEPIVLQKGGGGSASSAGKLDRTPVPTVISKLFSKDSDRIKEVYQALVLGTRDYAQKNGFKEVLVAVSGGIDSSLVASIAVDALGPDNVHGIFLPSCFTSDQSRGDAYALSKNMRFSIKEISIAELFDQYKLLLEPSFKGKTPDTTEENLQARIRGTLVMALSNKFGWLVLTTGNKSEMSVGYATLYGDMAGGFAVIKDVPKTLVYDLCSWRNQTARKKGWIPENVLFKPPTAELRADQKDTDSLPPYDVLDPVLKAYIEEDKSLEEIINSKCHPECAARVVQLIDLSEYKRRQAPPGIKITSRAFGRDRRYPITNKYRNY